ncbi:2'-5' RNA ligase family protein [Rhodococcus sp. NPDC058639]|uniref:2'-5' RNA ligase family protein n=1 Tax=Rhodococcus sp. NPDC058639 TaxID=3346570 RepID=UPI0036671E65
MVQSVELLLDESLDAAVRDEWTRMLDGGIDSQGRVRSPTNRPHVTLFVSAEIPSEVEDAVRATLTDTPLAVRLGGVVVFGDRHATLARLVVPSSALLDLHARVFELLKACPGVPAHIRPGEWTPHVTLARRVPADRIGAALVAARIGGRDLSGTSAGIRRWDGTAKREWWLV